MLKIIKNKALPFGLIICILAIGIPRIASATGTVHTVHNVSASTDFAALTAALQTGDTISLTEDIECYLDIPAAVTELTIIGNGHTMSNDNAVADDEIIHMLADDAVLSITDLNITSNKTIYSEINIYISTNIL